MMQVRLQATGFGPAALALIREDSQSWLVMKQVWKELCSAMSWQNFHRKGCKGEQVHVKVHDTLVESV